MKDFNCQSNKKVSKKINNALLLYKAKNKINTPDSIVVERNDKQIEKETNLLYRISNNICRGGA